MPLCNHVCGLKIFSPSVSTGARGRRRQHRGELTGPGGTLNGVSSPHSAFSKVAGKSFSVFNRFGPNLAHLLGGPRRGPPTNFEENPTTLSGLQRLKAKMTRKHLADGDQIYKIFVSMHYTCFMNIWRQSDEKFRSYEELCGQLTGISCILMLNPMTVCFSDIGKVRQRMWIKVSWIVHSNATNPLTSNLQPVQVCLRNYCHISKMAVRPYNMIQKAGRSGTW